MASKRGSLPRLRPYERGSVMQPSFHHQCANCIHWKTCDIKGQRRTSTGGCPKGFRDLTCEETFAAGAGPPDLALTRRGGAPQPVVDRLAKTLARDRRDRDPSQSQSVEFAQESEKVGRRLVEILRRRKVAHILTRPKPSA